MEYIYLGKIVNTHGIKGEVRIKSNFKYKDKVFVKGNSIYIGKKRTREVINSYRVHKDFDMITMEGIYNINDVLKYKGLSVFIKRSELLLDDGEFLDEDLIGLDVLVNGEVIGSVLGVEKDRYQDKIIVNKDGISYYVPYVCDIISEINIHGGYIVIQYIKGLLD